LQVPEAFSAAFSAVLGDHRVDPAFKSLMLTLPGESELLEHFEAADPEAIHRVREFVLKTLAQTLRGEWRSAFEHNHDRAQQDADAGRRELKNRALSMLCRLDDAWPLETARNQCLQAGNMTDQMGALLALRDRDSDERTECLEGFSEHWQRDPLVMDKYFALLASSQIPCTLDHVREALNHPAFSLKNPNKARALIGSFGRNMLLFHAADGSGYRFIADQVLVIDRFNPQVASRLVQLFNRWKKLEPLRRALMKAELERLAASELSKDVYEIVSKNLNQNQD
jgi:aminopeptidase N